MQASRILVVDDDWDTAESFRLVLDIWGFSVRTARNGRDALAVAGEFCPAVVFLDIGIPDLNGYEVARLLKRMPERPFIVIVSGFGTEKDRRQAFEAGADLHLLKPADLDEIKELLDALPRPVAS
jgi:DNA-binding response OmpR family regulator